MVHIFHRPSRLILVSLNYRSQSLFSTNPHILFTLKMLFRAAAIFTTLACAVSSFAAPLTAPDTSAVGGILGGLTGGAPIGAREIPGVTTVTDALKFGNLGARQPSGPLDALLKGFDARDTEHPTIPDAFQGACDQVLDIAVKLREFHSLLRSRSCYANFFQCH